MALIILQLSLCILVFSPDQVPPQDSTLAKKPAPKFKDNMPIWKGRGTPKPMPSPKYYLLPSTDTVKIDKTKRFEI